WNSKENLSERNRTLFLYNQLFTRLQNRPSSSGGQHGENGGQHGRILQTRMLVHKTAETQSVIRLKLP
ncbi:MAG TPA: hypothetical protein VG605_09185, partial [Puia sp.]|nr:hypothetical protein [Puia sp.]